jgi:inorganic pyrophosphatase
MDISLIPLGDPAGDVNVIVEIPQGSSIKYELDKKSGALIVDRFIHTAMVYPFNYGFIPQTHADDGDPIDVLLISAQPVAPGSVMLSSPIGLLEMEDEAGIDTKIIAVPAKNVDPWYAKVNDVTDLDEATHEKIKHFFAHYKELEEGKWVKIRSFLGKKEAIAAITKAAV